MIEFTDIAKEPGEFTIIATPTSSGIDYTAYECTALSLPDMIPHYLKNDWNTSLDLTADINEAEWFLKAFIRTDGFTSLDFNQDESVLQFSFDDFTPKMYKLLDKLRAMHQQFRTPHPEYGVPKEPSCPPLIPPNSSPSTSQQS